jgi:hypothetical protein
MPPFYGKTVKVLINTSLQMVVLAFLLTTEKIVGISYQPCPKSKPAEKRGGNYAHEKTEMTQKKRA